jgi:hypothetical protein
LQYNRRRGTLKNRREVAVEETSEVGSSLVCEVCCSQSAFSLDREPTRA